MISADDLAAVAVDTNGDGFKEIVDGWGNPVQFYRWPTANPAVDALRPTNASLFRDPLDPTGTLVSPVWYTSNQRPLFEAICHQIIPPNSVYLIPVIASAGRDGILGLDFTTMTVTPAGNAFVNDNIYSYNLHQ